MGLVLDKDSYILYENWLRCPSGKAMDGLSQKMIHEVLSIHKNDRILDIGCGAGSHLLSLTKLPLDLTGVDASPYMIDIAAKLLGNRCEFKAGLAEDLPFSDNEFDTALLINTLEFLDDPLAAIKEAGRVAKKKVIICAINSLSLNYLGERLGGIFRGTLIKYLRAYNLWELKTHIKNAYGQVPVAWGCTQTSPWDDHASLNRGSRKPVNSPFAPILGATVTLNPLVITGTMPLKIAVKKAEQPFAEGVTVQNNSLSDLFDG
jgi:SAM-dependent methyltransferase